MVNRTCSITPAVTPVVHAQEAYAELAASEAQLSSRADSSQAQLQKLVDAREKREQELYIKVLPPLYCAIYLPSRATDGRTTTFTCNALSVGYWLLLDVIQAKGDLPSALHACHL